MASNEKKPVPEKTPVVEKKDGPKAAGVDEVKGKSVVDSPPDLPLPSRRGPRMSGARMFHPGNGRDVFDTLPAGFPQGARVKVTKAVVKAMLRRENELRLSEEVQVAYAKSDGALEVTDDLQRKVAEEFGFDDLDAGVDLLRSAEYRYPDDPEIRELSLYRKFNRARVGDLEEGDKAVDTPVTLLSGETLSLLKSARVLNAERLAALNVESQSEDHLAKRVKKDRSSAEHAPVDGARPIVLIGGSYSWPPFREAAVTLVELSERYAPEADFLTVYIAEAHALDEWPMGDGFEGSSCKAVMQARTTEDRLLAAQLLIEELKYTAPLVLDSMEDHFEKAYAVWPVRFYIIQHGKIVYKAMPTKDYRYSTVELERRLQVAIEAAKPM